MPLTIDLPPAVLDALKGRAAARNRSPEQEAAVAVAASLDILLNPPAPPDPADLWPGGDWRNDAEAVAWVESVRAAAPVPPTAKPPEGSLQDYLRENEGVDVGMSPVEWDAYWWTLEYDGEAAAAERDVARERAAAETVEPPEADTGRAAA